jgi:adenylate cyclase
VNRSGVTRRLAAILFADVVGFSRRMEQDDAGTLARLREIRERHIDPGIRTNSGRMVKTTGDGFLAEFGSAEASLRCAVDLQRALAARNRSQAGNDRIELRIGINLGDIIIDGDDIAGDGVNVAARLEALAEPGGICISAAVRDQMHGSLDVRFVDIGEQQVKNIARPIRVFSVVLDPAAPSPPASATAASPPQSTETPPPSTAPSAMSVGVMPLVALAGDAAATQQAESITRDLTAMLARAATIMVVIPVAAAQARRARDDIRTAATAWRVRYLADGEIVRGPEATTVAIRLVNGATGEQIWSESASLRDAAEPAERWLALHAIAWHLSRALISAELRRVTAQAPDEASPLDYVLRALALDRTKDDVLHTSREQVKLLEEALQRDPNLVPALVLLSRVLMQQLEYDVHVDREQHVRRMNDLTRKAVGLNDTQPTTWVLRSMALMYMGQWNASLEAGARALRLEPYSNALLLNHAALTTLCGRPSEALELMANAGNTGQIGDSHWATAGEARLLLGEYDQAIAACEKAQGLGDDSLTVNLCLAAAYAHAGDAGRAAAAKDEVLRAVPGYSIAIHRSKGPSVHPDYLRLVEEHLFSGMRKAGFPEE